MPDLGSSPPFGDPGASYIPEPQYARRATELVVSLTPDGRTARLFTADGDFPSTSYPPSGRFAGGLENQSDQ